MASVRLRRMAQPVDVRRKLRQLDNDVQSIYAMLASITGTQQRHGNRLDELAEQLDRHGEQLGDHGEQLQRMDTKLDAILQVLNDGAAR